MKSVQAQKSAPVQTSAEAQSSQVLRRDFLRVIRDALQLLLRDIELSRDYQFFYVVDFAAVYAYLYRTSNHHFISYPGESENKTFSRMQLALQTLFTPDSRRLNMVLIPPYLEELDSHLRMLETTAGLAAVGIKTAMEQPKHSSSYTSALSQLIEKSRVFNDYIWLRDKQKREHLPPESISEEVQLAAVKVAKDYFPELYVTLALTELVDDRQKLRTLFDSGILLDSDEEIPDCRQIDYFGKRTDEWYDKIIQIRRKARATQSYTDAMACTYVQTANELLNPKKQIVVFVAPSRSVEAVLRESKMIRIEETDLAVVRDLTYCLISFMQKNDPATISENLHAVKRLLEIYESPIPVKWRPKGEEAADDWNRCENLLLIRDSSITNIPLEATPERNHLFLDILYQLHQAAMNGKQIEAEVVQTLSDLHLKTLELTKHVPATGTIETLRRVKFQRKGGRGQLVVPALAGELPFPISFTDRDVRMLAREVGKLKADSELLELRTRALDAASKQHATPEHHLLAGYILALERRYEAALAELEAGLLNATDGERLELLFVSASIHRKLYHTQEACELLEQGLAVDKEDLRLNIEYAKALWLKWREQADRHVNLQYLDIALEHLVQASHNLKTDLNKLKQAGPENISAYIPKVLRAQIENVSAYIHTEQALNSGFNAPHLTEAEAHVKTLQQLLEPRKEWIRRFFDTRGYFLYAKAKSLPLNHKQEKEALLISARQEVAQSLEKDEAAGPDLEVRREHLREIDQALRELGVARID